MHFKVAAFLLALSPLSASAETTYEFQPYAQKPGETLRIRSALSSEKGILIRERNGEKERGTITRMRTRQLDRRIAGTADSPRIEYKIINDSHTATNSLERDGGRQSRIGALVGQSVVGKKEPAGSWKLSLEGQPATEIQKAELAELEAYENRSWCPERPVKLGESWEINPAFLHHLMLRDLKTVELRATMTLTEIREIDGEATAVLKCALQSVGAKGKDSDTTAALNASGTLLVALGTMLEKKLVYTGTISSTARSGDILSSMSLPLEVEITKSVVKP